MEEKFGAIVVGAGLAGLAAAYTLAREGVEVLLLERGDYPGSKNVTGGRLYMNPVRDLFPELWSKAPFERFITREGVTVMAAERSLSMEYCGEEMTREPYHSYSILRAKFDRWLARQAERKGVMLVAKSRVDELILENGKVEGVRAAGDELKADVVIVCDGVLSMLTEKAGLGGRGAARDYGVGFKEVLELDPAVINDRFGLEGDEGAARLFMGEVTRGKFGGGFLYTNKDSISLGIVIGIQAMMEDLPAVEAPQMLEDFKLRPEVAKLIRGAQTVEYSAHAIPEGGFKALKKLYGDGFLVAGDAAGLAMNIGVTVRGMEYALASGCYAAQAVLQARAGEDYSAASLSTYEKLLNESFVLQDFKSFQEAPHVLENRRLFTHYPELIGNMLRDVYHIPEGPKNRLYPTIKNYLTIGEMWSMLGDARKVMKI